MGRPVSKKNIGLGRSLLNERARSGGMSIHSNKHDIDAVNAYGSNAKLRSITQEKALDEFLSTAELADTDFTAERLSNVRIVASDQLNPYLPTAEQEAATLRKHRAYKQSLTVPRRPAWDDSTTPQQLDRNEKESFLAWRRQLASLQEEHDLLLTPFERNLEVWRQLWRVVERSDLIVQIVDARDPLLFRSIDLESYVAELDKRKRNLLLVNKADLLTLAQRRRWAQYFRAHNVRFSFFSAYLAKEEQERRQQEAERAVPADEPESAPSDEESDEGEDDDSANDDVDHAYIEIDDTSADENDLDGQDNDLDDEQCDVGSINEESRGIGLASQAHQKDQDIPLSEDVSARDLRILTVDELEELFLRSAPEVLPDTEGRIRKTHIGLVGYPNVGKSSTINALVGAKTVSVSSTPGKTKHFQTIQLSAQVTLVDCPGLVFPNFASSQADLVCAGVLPIDQLREFTGPVALVARRVPKSWIEAVYGIHIQIRSAEEGGTGVPTAEELLISYAISRGYTKAGQGNPDESRAARYILKDYVNGKLLFVQPPPAKPPIDAHDFNAELYGGTVLRKRQPLTHVPRHASTYVEPDISHPPAHLGNDDDDDQSLASGAYNARSLAASGGLASRRMDRQFFSDEASSAAKARQLGSKAVRSAGGKVVMFPYQARLNDDGTARDMEGSQKMLTGRKARTMALAETGLTPEQARDAGLAISASKSSKKHFKGRGRTSRSQLG
ncbi:hypothetical protein PYCC9005_000058 [Savitreella phatthalungensis]